MEVDQKTLNRAYQLADKGQRILNQPNVSGEIYDKACETLRQARNLTARAYGMVEKF